MDPYWVMGWTPSPSVSHSSAALRAGGDHTPLIGGTRATPERARIAKARQAEMTRKPGEQSGEKCLGFESDPWRCWRHLPSLSSRCEQLASSECGMCAWALRRFDSDSAKSNKATYEIRSLLVNRVSKGYGSREIAVSHPMASVERLGHWVVPPA